MPIGGALPTVGVGAALETVVGRSIVVPVAGAGPSLVAGTGSMLPPEFVEALLEQAPATRPASRMIGTHRKFELVMVSGKASGVPSLKSRQVAPTQDPVP
jgi:hypothetical protein